jgi:hypothetical protein
MPIVAGPLDQHRRAVVDALLAVPAPRARALQHAGQPVPGPFVVLAVIDPGASISCVDPQVCQALSLAPFGTMTIITPSSGPNPPATRLYKVDLTILHPTGNPVLYLAQPLFIIAQANVAPLGADMLLGRDLLALCRFVYDGRAGTFALEY